MRNIRGCYMMWCLYTGCDPGRFHITEVLETVPRYLDIRRKGVATENSNVFAEKRAQAARGFLACPGQLGTLRRQRSRPRSAPRSRGRGREKPPSAWAQGERSH